MLTYRPGRTFAHRLDPRTKLVVQGAFAAAAFAHTSVGGLAALTVVLAGVLAAGRVSPAWALRELWFVLLLLVAAPVVSVLVLGPPWVELGRAREPALASYRSALVLLVAAAYVRTTPVRETRAAIQRHVPGRAGQFLGAGTAFVVRFLPLLQADLRRLREAMAARLGEERPVTERIRLVAVSGLNRAFDRADALALALRARCFAWNPTLPELRFTRLDAAGWATAAGLAAAAIV